MEERITHAKVHAFGEQFNDSWDVFVRGSNNRYSVSFSEPGRTEEQDVAFNITANEILVKIMSAIAYGYALDQVKQINITLDYGEE